ncbi:MAG: tetratricopeptide repeat protein [Planctomycetes bacterium]|nr:tetratricopeptide repeat protein [Planctomycetota bacterium]
MDEWLDELTCATRERPRHADGLCLLGDALASAGRAAEARAAYERALEINPSYRDAAIGLAFALGECVDFSAGFTAFRRLFPIAAHDPLAPFALGVYCLRGGWVATGIEQLERAAGLAPRLPFVALHLAAARAATGDDDEAERWLERTRQATRALGAEPPEPLRAELPDGFAAPGLIAVRIARARERLRAGHETSARAALDAAWRQFPGHWRLLLELGRLAAADGRRDDALRSLRAAATVSDDCHEAQVETALIHTEAGELAEALPHLEAAVAQRPTFPDYRFQLGTLLADLGRLDEAASELGLALALEPDYGQAAVALAEVQARLGAGDDALRTLLAGRWRDWPETFGLHAELLAGEGRWDEALGYVERVLAWDAADPAALELQLRLLARCGT